MTVSGRLEPRPGSSADGGCLVTVTYDMSPLPGSDPAVLDAYDDESFEAMMHHWAIAVNNVLWR